MGVDRYDTLSRDPPDRVLYGVGEPDGPVQARSDAPRTLDPRVAIDVDVAFRRYPPNRISLVVGKPQRAVRSRHNSFWFADPGVVVDGDAPDKGDPANRA